MMTPERWHQITGVFHEALGRDPEMRAQFLDEVCASDAVLRKEVNALLDAHENAGRFGDSPVFGSSEPIADSDGRFLSSRSDFLARSAAPGTTLGNYLIERHIGRGGMGIVCLAYDTRLHRRVALKLLNSSADGETARARLLHEARNAAALNHPGICTIHEVGESDRSAFIAMEYVDGRPITDRLGERPLPIDQVLRYGIQAADALAYAHDHGVIHRDFKAANVMITATGSLKIVDFGLARRTDTPNANASTIGSLAPAGVAVGTPYAMAPEQVRGSRVNTPADVWAFGVLLYEMATGAKPFDAPTTAELFSSILRDAPAPLPDSVPAGLKALIARCLQKEPEHRYQHAREVRMALEAIETGSPLSAPARVAAMGRRRWLQLGTSAVVAAGAALVGFDAGGMRAHLLGRPSAVKLAVLPFENLTGDATQEYFSDGLTEEMIAQLGRLGPQHLAVIARTSAMQYKKTAKPNDRIGGELGVDYILEGSTRREGSRVRITAQLIRVRDQTQLWADSFERELSGILAVQSDVTRGVARSLAIALLPTDETRLANVQPVNPEAYEEYLKGREHVYKVTRPDLDTALQYFERALQKDPNYALAYTGVSAVWSARQQFRFAPPREAAPKAKAAASKALALDGSLPEAHFRLGVLNFSTDWDWSAAEREFERAIELNPNFPDARSTYSHLLSIMKRPAEAMKQAERALQLDPFNSLFTAFYGTLLNQMHRYDDAIAQYDKVLRAVPNHTMALNGRRQALYQKHLYKEALEAERAVWAAMSDAEMVTALDRGYGEAGYVGAWRSAADVLAARSRAARVAPLDVWSLYLRAGDNDRALEWLEEGFQTREPNMIYIGVGPIYDGLRGDSRFQSLLRRMNLPS